MGRIMGLVVLVVALTASAAWAQGMQGSELTAGYTYSSLDQNIGLGSAGRLNANGWNTGGTIFMNNWLGFEGNFAGLSHSESASITSGGITLSGSASEKHYTYVFGPRFSFGKGSRMNPFVHGLFGFDRESLEVSASLAGTSTNQSASDTAFAASMGGGVVFGLAKHVGLTTSFDYLMTRHGIPSSLATILGTSGSATQNNYRVSAGIAFRFGNASWAGK